MIQVGTDVYCVCTQHGTIDLTQGLWGVFKFFRWWNVGSDIFRFTGFMFTGIMFKPPFSLGFL